jgi:cardiolipin synthase
MVRAGLKALPWGALALVSACAGSSESPPTAGNGPVAAPREVAAEVYQSPEFRDHGIAAPPERGQAKNRARTGSSVVADGFDFLRSLVVKPLLRPVSSLNRLVFLSANTAIDAVKPVSLLFESDGPAPPLSRAPAMDLDAWERRLDRITGSTASRGSIRLLIGGAQFFPRFVEAVMAARRSIHIRSYIFDTDDYATAVADLLKRRSREVEVKVLVDGLGSLVAAAATPASMPRDFDPPGSMERYLERNSRVQVRTGSNAWFTGDHTKTFLIDRRIAFVGGMNIGREYRYDWHDLMMEVRGPVVARIGRNFDRAWSRAGPFGDLAYLAQVLRPREPADAAADAGAGAGYPIRVLHTEPGDAQIYRAQLAAIRAARRYIYIHNPYFSDDEFLVELLRARRRGVDVRVVLSTRGDSPAMDRSNILAANALFRRGVRVYLYPGFSHVKAAIYDGWACLGSANLDKMSLRVNEELNLATSHGPAVQALERQLFEPDFEKSTEMTRLFEERWTYYLSEMLADQL